MLFFLTLRVPNVNCSQGILVNTDTQLCNKPNEMEWAVTVRNGEKWELQLLKGACYITDF